MKAITFNVDDLIESPGFQGCRLYSVVGVMWGATNQEGVVEMETLDRSDPDNSRGLRTNLFVPVEMLCASINAGIVKYTPAYKLDLA